MGNVILATITLLAIVGFSATGVRAQQPPFETRKIADNVYIYRHGGHQAMFVVTSDGVVATDPLNPAAAKVYVEEIRKVTAAPIRYVIYSHRHYDHISGGAPFKDAGATFVAYRRAKTTLQRLKNPTVVIPDLAIDDSGGVLTVGGTRVELHYVGRNHSDNSLVVLLPRERVAFAVDFPPIKEVLFPQTSRIPTMTSGSSRSIAFWHSSGIGSWRGTRGRVASAPRRTSGTSSSTWWI